MPCHFFTGISHSLNLSIISLPLHNTNSGEIGPDALLVLAKTLLDRFIAANVWEHSHLADNIGDLESVARRMLREPGTPW